MKMIMTKRAFLFFLMIMLLSITGCIKDTYNMSMLSKQTHLSPDMAISAVKGSFSLKDIVKPNDTITFDQNKLLIFVFKKNSIVDLKLADFVKGPVIQKTALIPPDKIDVNLGDILSHITGSFKILNPSIKFNYTNSFPDSVQIDLNVTGSRKNKSVDLNLVPFKVKRPNLPDQQEISSTFTIDKSNSNLPDLFSLPPEVINFSGTATISYSLKNSPVDYAILTNHLTGSLDIEIPMELEMTNLQFADTVDNFLKEDSNSNNPIKPEDFQLLQVKIIAENGFPTGVSLRMSLFDSSTGLIKNTVDAGSILTPAPVDSNGKVTGTAKSTATIEFTNDFFGTVSKADKIIFWLTLNTTGNGTQDVKIYSDYTFDFSAALVVKPDIKLN
jgi:hypothetical protein